MISKSHSSNNKKISFQLIAIAFFMSVGMTIYETLKQIISPNITIWESHAITIVFSTLCAVVASFFILRNHIELTSILTKKNIEGQRLQEELEDTIEKLRATLAEVKTLTGLLPICASCKKIRDDKGYWSQLESYFGEHSEIGFTHSICPECVKKLYPQIYEENKEI